MSMRVYGIRREDDISPHLLKYAEYGKWGDTWYAYCPGAGRLIANLGSHAVAEHEDGSITVSPSIACDDGAGGHKFHGFLRRGVWEID